MQVVQVQLSVNAALSRCAGAHYSGYPRDSGAGICCALSNILVVGVFGCDGGGDIAWI